MAKTSSSREIPPPLELDCLKALWHIGEGTVKDVRGVVVTESRKLAYTTVMTVLDRLEKRGTVQRKKVGRSFLYTPVLERSDLRRLAVNSLIDMFFEGSREDLIKFLTAGEDPRRPAEVTVFQPVETEAIDTALL